LVAGLSAGAVDFEAVVERTGSLTHFIFERDRHVVFTHTEKAADN
jgi:hypothetical protein